MATKTLANGETYPYNGVIYTATENAELKTDDSGVVTGINSGKVTAEIDGAANSPKLTF